MNRLARSAKLSREIQSLPELMEKAEPSGARSSADSSYLLDNAGREAPARFAALSAEFDPVTIRHLEHCGVGPGWRCLEVGGGDGSIANEITFRFCKPLFLATQSCP